MPVRFVAPPRDLYRPRERFGPGFVALLGAVVAMALMVLTGLALLE